jgi:hypothetical protein
MESGAIASHTFCFRRTVVEASTTYAIESLDSQIRSERHFPRDAPAPKLINLALRQAEAIRLGERSAREEGPHKRLIHRIQDKPER